MRTRRFGRTGLDISEITYGGGWVGGYIIRAGERERHAILDRSMAAGINWVDTAALYGNGASETVLGQWLAAIPADRRPRLSTKFNVDVTAGDFAGQVRASVAASLARLRLPRVDVLILHNRVVEAGRKTRDPRSLLPSEVLGRGGIADIMDDLRRGGLCDWIGLTGLGDPAALAEVVGSGRFDVMQGYYNLLNPTGVTPAGAGWTSTDFAGLLKLAHAKDVGVMGIRIFAAGHLATDVRHGRESAVTENADNPAEEARVAAIRAVLGAKHGSGAQAAVRFGLAAKELSTIVVGIGAPEHLEEALAAARQGPLPPDALSQVAAALRSHPAFRS